MTLNLSSITSILLISYIISLKLKTKNQKKFTPVEVGKEINHDLISEALSSTALHVIYSRASSLNETSCRMTAQMILLAICGIRDMEEISVLNLTNNNKENLNNIRNKLMKNYVIEIELRTNHHFIILKKNREELYLLQGFQDIFNLTDWISDKDIMKPYLKIDEFFDKMEFVLNTNNNYTQKIETITDLLFPKIFSKNKKKKNKIKNWFRGNNIKLVAVDYCSYNFEETEKNHQFDNVLDAVFDTYDLRTWKRFNKDFPDNKYQFNQ